MTVYIAYAKAAIKIKMSPNILFNTSRFGENPNIIKTARNAKRLPNNFLHVKLSDFRKMLERITTNIAFDATTMLASLAAVNNSPNRYPDW